VNPVTAARTTATTHGNIDIDLFRGATSAAVKLSAFGFASAF
jgi:hypothetical protein